MSSEQPYRDRVDGDGWTMYLADCRDVLPTLSGIDAVVTDPPYGIAYTNSGGGSTPKGARTCRRNANMPIHGDDSPFDPTSFAAWPCLMFGADHWRARCPAGGTFIAWDKAVGMPVGDSFSDCEFAWTNQRIARNVARFAWKGIASIKKDEQGGYRFHPTTKPKALMRWCLKTMGVDRGATVLDPFAGSGTTGVACIEMGFRFIGIEIDERYFRIACNRLRTATPSLFGNEKQGGDCGKKPTGKGQGRRARSSEPAPLALPN